MKKSWLVLGFVLGFVPVLLAQKVPGRYIVELDGESVAEHLAQLGRRRGPQSAAAAAQRTQIRAQQQIVRRQVEQRQATVLDSVDTVANALFVAVPDGAAAQLAAIPGVKRVVQERQFHLLLDHAVALHKVVDAWQQIGMGHAGEGIKIGIIDTGISSGHPGFQDSSLSVPDSFPRSTAASDLTYTNNKIIVARSYVNMLPNRDPDSSARDHVGHGTAVAMAAAGVTNTGPLASITGVAPRAWLGNYKVFGSPGYNDSASDSAILKALDDAVSDGMDVVNLSLGSDLAHRLADDPEVAAVERASSLGVIVVCAAGNNGPDLITISSPATAPHALAVGATTNDRTFAASVSTTDLTSFVAIVGVSSPASTPASSISGQLADVAALDTDGQACSTLAGGSLTGRIALIRRGTCTFQVKTANVQRAGAIAALVYANQDSPDPISMSLGTSTLPAEMISYSDGTALKQSIASQSSVTVTMQFTLSAVSIAGNRLTDFSAAGPNVDAGIKPDLMAVGADIYLATQTLDTAGEMYDASGYIQIDGTSFSSPLVAGAAALIKSARPGLTLDQYRSLLIDSAAPALQRSGQNAAVQQSGGGVLNVYAALQSTVTAYPALLSFGGGGSAPNITRSVTLTNVGTAPETYTLAALPSSDNPAPSFSSGTVDIAPGASLDVPVSWSATGLKDGSYEGSLTITAASTGNTVRVPYWYAATSGTPAHISLLGQTSSGRRGSLQRDAVLFRITDISGLPLGDSQPEITVTSGGGTINNISQYDSDIPGLFGIDVRLGPTAGSNVIHIQAGSVSVDVTITGA